MTQRSALLLVAASLALLPGCVDPDVDTTYGKSRDKSINGTGAFAQLLRARGHKVRAAVRLNDTVGNWANVMVRFAVEPGLPEKEEGRWLVDWVRGNPGRRLVYVVRDFDAETEYWDAVIAAHAGNPDPSAVERSTARRDRAKQTAATPPAKPPANPGASTDAEAEPPKADSKEWFVLKHPGGGSTSGKLGGPWAEGVDAGAAAVHRGSVFDPEPAEPVYLSGDGSPLVISWNFPGGGQVLAVANASFLLNGSLLNRARRPLTVCVADWIGDESGNVAFIEGRHPLAPEDNSSPLFRLFQIQPFGWVLAQFLAFLLVLAFAHAVRLGRPIPEPPSGVEKPSAHPEALGVLFVKTGRADLARAILDVYRKWRPASHAHAHSHSPGRKPSESP